MLFRSAHTSDKGNMPALLSSISSTGMPSPSTSSIEPMIVASAEAGANPIPKVGGQAKKQRKALGRTAMGANRKSLNVEHLRRNRCTVVCKRSENSGLIVKVLNLLYFQTSFLDYTLAYDLATLNICPTGLASLTDAICYRTDVTIQAHVISSRNDVAHLRRQVNHVQGDDMSRASVSHSQQLQSLTKAVARNDGSSWQAAELGL